MAEHNLFFDPTAANEVFESGTTKSLVPLDVSRSIKFGVDLLDQLPSKASRAGALLHKILPFSFRMAHQHLGREMIPLYDPTALVSVLEPELFTWKEMAGRVETKGQLTRGATVFDRRLRPEWQVNMEVAMEVDTNAVKESLVRSLRFAGQES